jgi:creatinine amidohydrolase/Fe(II)-dependent formamide hydrolase-like protein
MSQPKISHVYLTQIPLAQARTWVETGAPVIAFFNPVEFHGPHLPLDTDTLLSYGCLKSVYERLEPSPPFLVYATLQLGCGAVPTSGTSQHHYAEIRRAVINTCHGLRDLGAKRAVLMTFHGEPLHNLAIEEGVKLLRSWGIPAMAPMNVVMHESLLYRPENYEEALATLPEGKIREHYRKHFVSDFHGGFFETSLMLQWHEDKVGDYTQVPACAEPKFSAFLFRVSAWIERLGFSRLAREIDFANYGSAWARIKPTPGHTGHPALANLMAGTLFSEKITYEIVSAWNAYFNQGVTPPGPILRWVKTLTFGGRIL